MSFSIVEGNVVIVDLSTGLAVTTTSTGIGKRSLDVTGSFRLQDKTNSAHQVAVSSTGSMSVDVKNSQEREKDFGGTITSTGVAGAFQFSFEGYQSCAVQLTGTWVGTLYFEVSYDDGTTWFQSSVHQPSGILNQLQVGIPEIDGVITKNGIFKPNSMGGVCRYRLRAVTLTGTVIVWVSLTESPNTFSFTQSSIIQNVIESINNSTTTNLATGTQFIGTPDSTLGVFAIQFMFICDQRCKIEIQQSTDGMNWDISDVVTAPINTARGRSYQAVGSYVRVIITNQGGQTTGYIRLKTYLCPVGETLPRALTDAGSLKVAIVEDNPSRVEGELIKYSTQDIEVRQLLEDILEQMVLMNIHLGLMTDEHINDYDINGAD